MDKKTAIVTGGSSGIGYAITKRLASENYAVINADIDVPTEKTENIEHVLCDVRKAEDIHRMVEAFQDKSPPEVLVLNAGKGIHEKLREGDPEKWLDILNINVGGVLRVLRAVLPFMKKGHIIFISSVAANTTYEYGSVYAASKSAVNTIAETLRIEEQPDIIVTVIAAGVVDTSFFENAVSATQNVESIGWGAVEPKEVAEAVVFSIQRKPSTAVNHITIRPPKQPL